MYTREQLEKYPFLKEQLVEHEAQDILDPLTGVLSRAYSLDMARYLIEAKIPFSFSMLDLDNFKFINDSFGHKAGDRVLSSIGESLAQYVGERGVVGRFGGDEFLIIDLADRTYEEKKAFMRGIYANETVLRRNIRMENCNPFVTGTIGCATYPDDATDYDELFALIDKTLYRGKTKGRNCHIIYVEEKHKNIEIRQLARHGVYTVMHHLIRQFELVPTIQKKLYSVLPLLIEELRISDLYVIDQERRMYAVCNREFCEYVPDVDKVVADDLYSTNQLSDISENCPVFYEVLRKHEMETMLVVKVSMDMDTYGYLICAEPRNRRIWQEDECAILYFLAKLIAMRLELDGEELGRAIRLLHESGQEPAE